MINQYDCRSVPKIETATATAGSAVTITIDAEAGVYHVLEWVAWSYSAAAGTGRLTVSLGGTTVLDMDIRDAGPGSLVLSEAALYTGTKNEALVVTLAAVTSVTGKLTIQYR